MVVYFLSSLLLHILVFLFIQFGNISLKKQVQQEHAITLDVVSISELTNITSSRKDSKSEIVKEIKKEELPKPSQLEKEKISGQPKKTELPLAKEKSSVSVEQKALATKKIDTKPLAPKTEQKKLITQSKQKNSEKKSDNNKAKVKEDDLFSETFLKDMQKKVKQKSVPIKSDSLFDKVSGKVNAESDKNYNENMEISITSIDAVRSAVQQVWNTASFSAAQDLNMQATIYIKLNTNGEIIEVHPKKGGSGQSSVYYSAFLDSAIRAVQAAAPFHMLPKDQYNTWKEIEFMFDSKGMIY